jgi:DNA-binding transcriptional LysR family regulator
VVDLNELQFFVQVCKEQSFTLAAIRLGIPKSNISRAVLRLEERLGVRLLERTTRRVRLTEVGELYLDRCQRVLEDAEEADLLIDALQARPRGKLRVGVHIAFFQLFPAPVLREFLSMYADLRLQFQMHGGYGPSRDRNVDLSILGGPLEDSGSMVKSIVRIRLGAYASPSYLENCEIPSSPADLHQHSCILKCGMSGERGESTIWRLRRGSEIQKIRIESRVSLPDPMIHHQLAVAGVGVALLSQTLARVDVEEGRLVRLLPEWEPDPVELYAVYPSRLNSSPKVRAFVQFLQKHLATDSLPKLRRNRAAGESHRRRIASRQ